MSVHELHPAGPDREIIAALEKLLEFARRGEVRSIAFAAEVPANVWKQFVVTEDASPHLLLGAVTSVQFALTRDFVDEKTK